MKLECRRWSLRKKTVRRMKIARLKYRRDKFFSMIRELELSVIKKIKVRWYVKLWRWLVNFLKGG